MAETEKERNLIDSVKDYVNVQSEIIALKAIDKGSDVASNLAARIAVAFFVAMLIIFSSLGLALYIGELLNSYALGFALIGALFGLIGLIIHVFKKKLIKEPLVNSMVKNLSAKADEAAK